MDLIINEVTSAVKDWKKIAQKIGIPISEINYMEGAFRIKII